ncbi:MAG: hypothetical protein HY294_01195 [Candidatus Rokubacteria bacterium]|nr:hypothetical protein [Candidatus Rokubacteria bacterium]
MPVPKDRIPVSIPEAACIMAIGPRGSTVAVLSDTLIAKISGTPRDTTLGPDKAWRHVICTAAEAEELRNFFQALADSFSTHGDSKATVCAQAVDNIRHALRTAGISN